MNLKSFLPHNILKYHLYIFQLEEYDIKRFWKALFKKGIFPPTTLRKKAVWTVKAKALVLISLILQFGFSLALGYLVNAYTYQSAIFFLILFLILFYLFTILGFFFLAQAQDILMPLENYQKNKIIKKAKLKLNQIKSNPDSKLKIIGITGSYGKTTMKEVLATVLDEKFKMVKTIENQNTPIGIARVILNKLNLDTEVFIVEMGEYVKGDVDAICKLTPPDISIITGINEAHLERYGNMQNAIDTKFEIVENTPEGGLVVLNADDKLIKENVDRFAEGKRIEWYSSKNDSLSKYLVQNVQLDVQNLGLNFSINRKEKNSEEVLFRTKFLAEYIIGNIVAAMVIAEALGMNETEIRLGVSKVKPVEHRLEPSRTANDIIIIDDTYNGNSDGIQEGINLLSKFENRRKVYITPGLVETGELAESIHVDIGKQLASVADLVVLIKNSVTGYIEKGLLDSGFKSENIIWFDNSKETYSSLNKFVKPGDVVMMQNDWGDQYS